MTYFHHYFECDDVDLRMFVIINKAVASEPEYSRYWTAKMIWLPVTEGMKAASVNETEAGNKRNCI